MFWAIAFAAPLVTHIAIATGGLTALASVCGGVQAAAIAVVAWRAGGWVRAGGLTLAGVLVVLAASRALDPRGEVATLLAISGVSHAILYSSLLLLFGRTLQPGRCPLVTTMAQLLEPGLTPARIAYTRGVTVAWCGFFAAELLVSAVLLLWAPHAVWSLFVNVLDGPLVAAMFIAEYGVRCVRFRGEAHVSPITIIRSFAARRPMGDHV